MLNSFQRTSHFLQLQESCLLFENTDFTFSAINGAELNVLYPGFCNGAHGLYDEGYAVNQNNCRTETNKCHLPREN